MSTARTPSAPGRTRARAFALLTLLTAFGCNSQEGPLPAEQDASAPVSVRAAAEDRWARGRGFVGVVVAGDGADIEPKVEGRIEQVFVKPGDRVSRGEPIAQLETMASRHDLKLVRAALVAARRRFARRLALAQGPSGAIAAEEIDDARRDLLQEQARTSKVRGAVAEASIEAPFDGVVSEQYLTSGALAGPGRPIVRLLGKGEPRVRFAVPEENVRQVTLGQSVQIEVAAARVTLRGRVTGLSPEVDASSRMIYGSATLAFDPEAKAPDHALATGLLARVFLVPGQAPAGGAPGPGGGE
jgi:RND family efflux transporter MFP subunit